MILQPARSMPCLNPDYYYNQQGLFISLIAIKSFSIPFDQLAADKNLKTR
jgi:hypothetical protein